MVYRPDASLSSTLPSLGVDDRDERLDELVG